MTFELVIGKKTKAFDNEWLRELTMGFAGTALDIGTGDGRFVIDGARAEPKWLWVGLDPVAENMSTSARISSASLRKGGLSNVLFLRGAAEQLPGPLRGIADQITINYPWGSLMRTVALAEPKQLKKIIACGKPGATLSVCLNYSVFEDLPYLERIGLTNVSDLAKGTAIIEGYIAAGCSPPERRVFLGDPPFRSQWGRKLVRGSQRKSLLLETHVADGGTV